MFEPLRRNITLGPPPKKSLSSTPLEEVAANLRAPLFDGLAPRAVWGE